MATNPLTLGERAAFDYLLGLANTLNGDEENEQAFRDEFPDLFPSEATPYIWTFFFRGGGTPDETAQVAGLACGINGTLTFDGLFISKETAQEYACLLRNSFPVAPGTILDLLYILTEVDPDTERAVVKRKPDQTTSGPVEVWRTIAQYTAGIRCK